jgi:hypothetical protein
MPQIEYGIQEKKDAAPGQYAEYFVNTFRTLKKQALEDKLLHHSVLVKTGGALILIKDKVRTLISSWRAIKNLMGTGRRRSSIK